MSSDKFLRIEVPREVRRGRFRDVLRDSETDVHSRLHGLSWLWFLSWVPSYRISRANLVALTSQWSGAQKEKRPYVFYDAQYRKTFQKLHEENMVQHVMQNKTQHDTEMELRFAFMRLTFYLHEACILPSRILHFTFVTRYFIVRFFIRGSHMVCFEETRNYFLTLYSDARLFTDLVLTTRVAWKLIPVRGP